MYETSKQLNAKPSPPAPRASRAYLRGLESSVLVPLPRQPPHDGDGVAREAPEHVGEEAIAGGLHVERPRLHGGLKVHVQGLPHPPLLLVCGRGGRGRGRSQYQILSITQFLHSVQ